jgi:hypothetical protein
MKTEIGKAHLKTLYPWACPSRVRFGSFGVFGLLVCTVLVSVVIATADLASLIISALDSHGLFSFMVQRGFIVFPEDKS